MARNNGAVSALAFNPDGGDVTFGANVNASTMSGSGNLNVHGHTTTTELNLPSGGMVDWANGDARIVEGLVNNYSLSFQTWNGSALNTALRLDGDNTAIFEGNVGIGTTTPSAKLHINDGSAVTTSDANNMLLLTRNNHAYIMFSCPDGKDSGLHFHNTTDNSFVGRIAYDHNSTGDNMLFTVGSVEAMRIESGGNVGIGTTNPANKLDVRGVGTVARFVSSNAYVDQIMVNSGATNFLNFNGSTFNLYNNGGSASNVTLSITPTDATFTGNVTVEGALTETSARRFKGNIKTLDKQINNISKLNPVTFDWKKDGKSDIGFIAEEVKEIYPELVSEKEGEIQGVQYTKLTAVLVKAIQDQQKQIDELKKEIFILKKK